MKVLIWTVALVVIAGSTCGLVSYAAQAGFTPTTVHLVVGPAMTVAWLIASLGRLR